MISGKESRVVFFINYGVMKKFKCSFTKRILRRFVIARDDVATRQSAGVRRWLFCAAEINRADWPGRVEPIYLRTPDAKPSR